MAVRYPARRGEEPPAPPWTCPRRGPTFQTMDRRDFSRLSGVALAGLAVPAPLRDLAGRRPQELRVDGERLNRWLAELAPMGANAGGGQDRVAFSDADVEGRAWVAGLMREAGLDVSVDLAGNLWGKRAGTEPGLLPLVLGSHIDSVPNGGNYDGTVGSLAAVEVATRMKEAGLAPRHPLHVVVFANEEGGKTGSRILAGTLDERELELPTASGHTIGEGLRRVGGDPSRLAEARMEPGSFAAYLELHIEQGAVLDDHGEDIGVVQGIVGIMRWNVTVEGMTNHAGTTPMRERRDAMVAAARFVDAVHTTVTEWPGGPVATVGRLEAEPGVPNVIPGRATLSLEIRALTMEAIEEIQATLARKADDIGGATGTAFAFDRFYVSGAAPATPALQDVVEEAARGLGLTTRRMPSGAGHDAQSMAHLGPMGMIFVPSVRGISHAPGEYTSPEDCAHGADVLLRAFLALDRG